MSFTDGMDKTPGVRQHNEGWATLARTGRREEAVVRNKAFQAGGCVSARELRRREEALQACKELVERNPGKALLREIFEA